MVNLSKQPFTMAENRVSYLMKGGSMIDSFYGHPGGTDNTASQAWIASTVQSAIGEAETGLSRLSAEFGGALLRDLLDRQGEAILGAEHLRRWGRSPGFLLKLLHSDQRLLVQVHPSREKAMAYFGSPYGKTEAWYVIGTKPGAVIYAGFKPEVSRERFAARIVKEDSQAILDCLHCFSIRPGDVVFIPAGLPHALGGGSLVAEIQEPTDITLRAERIRPDGVRMSEAFLHGGIGMDGLLDCFDWEFQDKAACGKKIFIAPQLLHSDRGVSLHRLIGEAQTSYFAMDLIALKKDAASQKHNSRFVVGLVLEGDGELQFEGKLLALKGGTEFFIPYGLSDYRYQAGSRLRVMECHPPHAAPSPESSD